MQKIRWVNFKSDTANDRGALAFLQHDSKKNNPTVKKILESQMPLTMSADMLRKNIVFCGPNDIVASAEKAVAGAAPPPPARASTRDPLPRATRSAAQTDPLPTENKRARTACPGAARVEEEIRKSLTRAQRAKSRLVRLSSVWSRRIGGEFAEHLVSGSVLLTEPDAEMQEFHGDSESTISSVPLTAANPCTPTNWAWILAYRDDRTTRVIPASHLVMTVSCTVPVMTIEVAELTGACEPGVKAASRSKCLTVTETKHPWILNPATPPRRSPKVRKMSTWQRQKPTEHSGQHGRQKPPRSPKWEGALMSRYPGSGTSLF